MKKCLSVAAVLLLSGLLTANVNAQEPQNAASAQNSDASWNNTSKHMNAAVEPADNKNAESEEIDQLIEYMKQKAADGELETEEDILGAVKEGEEKFGVRLSEEEVQKILDVMNKLKGLGLDSEYLIAQAERLYDKYGAEIVNQADEAVSEAVSEAVDNAAKGFFESVKESVIGFWNSIFK